MAKVQPATNIATGNARVGAQVGDLNICSDNAQVGVQIGRTSRTDKKSQGKGEKR